MKKILAFLSVAFALFQSLAAQTLDEKLPVRGFVIEAPSLQGLERFVKFIDEELAPSKVNLLVLRVDWNYAYTSHPELQDEHPLTRADVEKLVAVCRKNGIRLVPQVNLLGHQSWAKQTHALLRAYPEFDETPSIKTENYSGWPNPDGLYCKSYCPLHPDVHKVVFDIVDEICEVFQSDAFHAGMDEVFYIGEKECPRCNGRDKAELFAGEVRTVRDHLVLKGRQLMIWGDRLLDGRTTGLGEWEASYNGTWRAVDLIPKDVLICDWHYERADLSAVYFAMKGLPVVTCGYRNPELSVRQVDDMIRFRAQTTAETAGKLQGYVHTVWSGADHFLRAYYATENVSGRQDGGAAATKAVLKHFRELAE